MKFIVRNGFVVHDSKLVKIKQGDKEVKQIQTNSHYEGQTVDFDPATALDHLHKLEPADKEAIKFAETRHAPVVAVSPTGEVGITDPAIAALTAQVAAIAELMGRLTQSVQIAVTPPAA